VVVATTEPVGNTGAAQILRDGLDLTGGVRADVIWGGHSDYRIQTPEDLARSCSS
jgi:hypothetical protein